MSAVDPAFQEDRPPLGDAEEREQLILELEGFDGPIDLLLTLARDQKVDLAKISILALAEQYLAFVEKARRIRIELAADYLVMAAWLAYLKSRLLIPEQAKDDEASGEELAEALQFQLRRLEALRGVAARLQARPQLGREVFARGMPEGIRLVTHKPFADTLFDLIACIGDIRQRKLAQRAYAIKPLRLVTIEEAIERFGKMLGRIPGWASLSAFLPPVLREDGALTLESRSALASTFGASLELAKRGELQIRQEKAFGTIYIRRRPDGGEVCE
jgi:segregation and condensation protein A